VHVSLLPVLPLANEDGNQLRSSGSGGTAGNEILVRARARGLTRPAHRRFPVVARRG
jgi:hypothetical protein